MRNRFDCVIITNIPNYYKINLYNQLSNSKEILVVFLAETSQTRNSDFYSLDRCKFEYVVLFQGDVENRNIYLGAIKLFNLIRLLTIKSLIISEWYGLEYWIALIMKRNIVNKIFTLESNTLHYNAISFFKGIVKRIFVSGIDIALVSGPSHAEVIRKLGFKNKLFVTNGVGISNDFSYQRPVKRDFNKFSILFVGRLVNEKNIKLLINSFNEACKFKNLKLTIVGDGPLKSFVRHRLHDRINYIEKLANSDMNILYKEHDILILPSLIEPWGLVIEEALASQMPVIVSQFVGCLNAIVFDGVNGLVVDARNSKSIVSGILDITSQETYEKLQSNARLFSREIKDKEQLEVYLNVLQ